MPNDSIQATVSLNSDGYCLHILSLSHLQTLSYFIEVLPDLRAQHLSDRLDTRKSCAYHGTAAAGIFMAVAFLEAQINETLLDVHQRQIEIPDPAQRELLHAQLQKKPRKSNGHQWSCIDKYQFVLSVLQKPELDSMIVTPTKKLTYLRNELVHYDPVLQFDPAEKKDPLALAQKLSSYFMGDNPKAGFPDSCLCVEAVNWAYITVRTFSQAFFKRLGTEIPYGHLDLVDPTSLRLQHVPNDPERGHVLNVDYSA